MHGQSRQWDGLLPHAPRCRPLLSAALTLPRYRPKLSHGADVTLYTLMFFCVWLELRFLHRPYRLHAIYRERTWFWHWVCSLQSMSSFRAVKCFDYFRLPPCWLAGSCMEVFFLSSQRIFFGSLVLLSYLLPGVYNYQVEDDISKLKLCVNSLLQEYSLNINIKDDYIHEL